MSTNGKGAFRSRGSERTRQGTAMTKERQLGFGFGEYGSYYGGTPPHQDRKTSIDAAKAIKPNAATLRRKVLDAIEAAGPHGLTDQEIQDRLGMEGNTERPRRRELESAGFIKDSGTTRKTATGRKATVWVKNG